MIDDPAWAIAYHSNSLSPRGKKWYYVTRVVRADEKWWELYRHPDPMLTSRNKIAIREMALIEGLPLLHGLFHSAPSPRNGSEMVWSLQEDI